jgi:hypothetical protein
MPNISQAYAPGFCCLALQGHFRNSRFERHKNQASGFAGGPDFKWSGHPDLNWGPPAPKAERHDLAK